MLNVSTRSTVRSCEGAECVGDIHSDMLATTDFVKVEDFEMWKKDIDAWKKDNYAWQKVNDIALKKLMRYSFIAGVLLGIFVLVAIIMAAVSLQESGKNA